MKKNNFLLFGLLVACFLLPGCHQKIRIVTNTFADRESIGYDFEPGTTFNIKSIDDDEMLGKEVCRKIARILRAQGYQTVSESEADYTITFKTSIRTNSRRFAVPHYIPGPVQTTRGNVINEDDEVIEYQQQTATSGHTGYIEQEVIEFDRNLLVNVYDAQLVRKTGKKDQVWQGTASSHGACDDLREVIGYLLDTVFEHFGHDTHKKVQKEISIKWDGIGQYY